MSRGLIVRVTLFLDGFRIQGTIAMMRTIILLLLLPAITWAQADPLAVVKKAIDAHGGTAALTKTRTSRTAAKGTMTSRGQDVPFTATAAYAMPEKFRMEITADISGSKFVVLQVLNGKKMKMVAKLGTVESPIDEKSKEELVQAGLLQDISTLAPLLDKKYTLKTEPDVDLNGNAAAVVSVTGNGLREVRLHFDKASGRLVKTARSAWANTDRGIVEVKEETYLSDFKKFGETLLPTATAVNHDGKKFMAMTVTDWKFVDTIDDKEFATE
jgi:hypothetical protein